MARVTLMLVLAAAVPAVVAGDPEAGRRIALDRDRGDCIICHRLLPEARRQQGNVGPPLLDVGGRLSREELYTRVVDARRINPGTMMPPYGSTENLHRVAKDVRGEPILTEKEIEDVVAWLETLTGTVQDHVGTGDEAP